jgi:hypothetical protein
LRICAKHASGKAGQESLAFMDHRLRCNILYLRAFLKGTELREVCGKKKPDELTAEEKQQVVRICDEALTQMDQWMKFYAELMPDRGAEGMLISFYHTPPAELKRIRFEYAGVGKDEVPKSTADLQGPPEPLQFGTKRK